MVQRTDAGTELIRLAWPDVGAAEAEAVAEVLESGQLTMGPKVEEFERGLAAACGTEHAVVVSSGTAALHLAVLALGIGPGDEVLVPAYTFPSTANVVAFVGAKPVLVDVDPETMNLDPQKLEPGATDEGDRGRRSLRPAGADRAAPGGCARARGRRGRARRASAGAGRAAASAHSPASRFTRARSSPRARAAP